MHGAPDNYDVKPTNITNTLQDDAELAIRLGAISSIDRLGNVIFADDFSNGKGSWLETAEGTGADVSINGDIFKFAGFSCKITARSDDPYLASIYNQLHYPDLSSMGFEINFSRDSNVSYILLPLSLYEGLTLRWSEIKIDFANNKLQYLLNPTTYKDIATGLRIPNIINIFQNLKLKVDFITNHYINVRYNSTLYNLSDIPVYTENIVSHKHLRCEITPYSKPGTNGVTYLDSVIITRNEL
ncbi:hypothetical protein ES708_24633 [subsurface metagenome]